MVESRGRVIARRARPWYEGEDFASLLVAASIGGTLVGTVVPGLWDHSEPRRSFGRT